MKHGSYSNQPKIFQEIAASKFQVQHAAQFSFCRYEGLYPATKTEIQLGCFPRNSGEGGSYGGRERLHLKKKNRGREGRAVILEVSGFHFLLGSFS